MELSPITIGMLVVAALLVMLRVGMSTKGAKKVRRRTPGPAAAGAFYEMLNEDKRNAIEIVVEQKAAARDEETADDIVEPGAAAVSVRAASTLFVAGWALYITVVAASNTTELLHSLGVWSPIFRSGNLGFLATATSIYGFSEGLNQLLLAGVILWEGSASVLLWSAAARLRANRPGATASARLALTVLGLLWFAFAIMTEVFIAYARGVNESMYWTLATAVLATLVVVQFKDTGPD